MTIPAEQQDLALVGARVRHALRYCVEALILGAVYFGIAKASLGFASINPSATPIWPPTGLALAILILRGPQYWPAILVAAFLTNLTTAGTIQTSVAIAIGNTLEAVVAMHLVNRFAGGREAFVSQWRVGTFAASAAAATALSATIGVVTLSIAGLAAWKAFVPVWTTWWLGDLAGALVVAPVIILWAKPGPIRPVWEFFLLCLTAVVIGMIVFGPLFPGAQGRGALAFLVILPLMWSALNWGQKETAAISLILSAFATLGTATGVGPFAGGTLNDSFLLLIAFMLSVTLPSLALSASIVGHREAEHESRREARRVLETTREQLAQAQKMEALGQLTGGIAHDFNNLLHVIYGYAQLVAPKLPDERSSRGIEAIQLAVKRGQTLTRQLLSFARQQRLEPVALDLRQHLESIRGMLLASLRGDIELDIAVEGGLWPVIVDVAELEFALVNIAVNARDAMPTGGHFRLSARNARLDDSVEGLSGDFVRLDASDTGHGIAPDILGRIFEPFFTTKPVGKGTGLGLSQVYGFARQSGGKASVTSTPGAGATVTLYLRRAVETAAASPQNPSAAVSKRHGRVLVVDDSDEVRTVISALFHQLGYEADTAVSAAAALERLNMGPRPDLVFSDVMMPGAMNGIDLANAIRVQFPTLPVVLTSGYSDVLPPSGGRTALLAKPFDLTALDQAVRQALNQDPP